MQSETQYTLSKDGVTDTLNDIIWEPISKERTNQKLDYESAQDYCDALELDGRRWRLPSLDELYSIVNYNYVKPSVSPKFGKMAKKYYWSDIPFKENKAYVVGFSIGSVATSPQINESHFRCVSDLE